MSRLQRFTIVLFATALAVPASLFASDVPMTPGNWEVTTKIEMPGMPVQMKPITVTTCIKEEDLKDPQKSLPQQSKNSDCKISDFKRDGNKVSWTMSCEGKQKMSGSGEITYEKDSYTGFMKMKMEEHEMTMNYKARRLGDCKK